MKGVHTVEGKGKDRDRIAVVEQLRGVAAFAVAWFHFTNGNRDFLADGLLKSSGALGWVGVQMFFVVSAFIIPFTMHERGYETSRHYFRFLLKRVIRLEPPYLASVLLAVLLGYVSSMMPRFRGVAATYSGNQLLLHIGYLVGFTRYEWVNPVFWSLAIEFQFYLVIGLIFPLIASAEARIRFLSLGGLAALAFLPLPDTLLPPYLLVFVLGILTFYLRLGWIAKMPYVLTSILCGVAIYLSNSPVIAAATLGTAYSIAFIRGKGVGSLVWLGAISYSLYLIHVPIGGRIINLGERLETRVPRVFWLFAALGVSLAVATLWYRWLESPAKRWSSAMEYRSGDR